MKTALTLLFALALALSQWFGVNAVSAASAAASPCCSCGGKNCCVKKADRPAKETPAVPTANSAQKGFQSIVWMTTRTLPLLEVSKTLATIPNLAASSASVVSLFTRDCAYLL